MEGLFVVGPVGGGDGMRSWILKRLGLCILMALLPSCQVKFHDIGAIRTACEMVKALKMDEGIRVAGRKPIPHGLRCEDAAYVTKVSPHTKKAWKADYANHFAKGPPGSGVNANKDAYKKWGFGDREFFIISDNVDDASASSRTFYFYLNGYKMPRMVGATLYDAGTRKGKEFEFDYDEVFSSERMFESESGNRKVSAERSF